MTHEDPRYDDIEPPDQSVVTHPEQMSSKEPPSDNSAYREPTAPPRSELLALGAWTAIALSIAFFGIATIGTLAFELVPLFSGVWMVWAGIGFVCIGVAFLAICVIVVYRYYRRSPYRPGSPKADWSSQSEVAEDETGRETDQR